ncbi:hypothetical protein [Amycolatopsis sp. WGS_07]|uniref:hypothetical protein n=1 Tax=Amycolatopsis sp. WGS_07 TaxID=3076764 RepID=UPI0038732957
MTTFTYTILEIIPRALLLIVGLIGLILSASRRSRGGSGMVVAAFAVMLVTTALGIVWQFMLSDVGSWMASDHLSSDEMQTIFMAVSIPLGLFEVLSWLLVVLAVVKGARTPQPGFYPTGGQPQAGYAQPGYAQPGYPQAGYPQSGYAQPGYAQPGQPGYPQPGQPQAAYPQPEPPQPGQPQAGYPQPEPPQPGQPQAGQPQPGQAQPEPPHPNPGEGPQQPPN